MKRNSFFIGFSLFVSGTNHYIFNNVMQIELFAVLRLCVATKIDGCHNYSWLLSCGVAHKQHCPCLIWLASMWWNEECLLRHAGDSKTGGDLILFRGGCIRSNSNLQWSKSLSYRGCILFFYITHLGLISTYQTQSVNQLVCTVWHTMFLLDINHWSDLQ